MKKQHALYWGRFQPPTNGHASTVRTIMENWRFLTIGVVYNSPKPVNLDPRWDPYVIAAEQDFYASRNPFTPVEIAEMWNAYIETERMRESMRCVITLRPYFDPALNVLYPPDEVDMVWANVKIGNQQMDTLRRELYPLLLRREVHDVYPTLQVTNERMLEEIMSGNATWTDFIPKGACEVFMDINGPARMLESTKLK